MRFRAEQHLRRQSDIRTVREQGRRIDCGAFTLWWKTRPTESASPDPTIKSPRVCVIASTKAVGGAVQRTRAKRRLRDVFRQQQHCVPPGCDLLLIARLAATTWPLPELEKKFGAACHQIRPVATPEN